MIASRPRQHRFAAPDAFLAALGACVVAIALCVGAALAAPAYPPLTGQIVDLAGLITAEDRAAVLADLKALEGTSTDQVAVVTVKSLEGYPIEEYSIGLARQWQIGQKDKDNGIVLLVAPNERKVRIEVGRRLEPIMTDTMSRTIIDTSILPRFRRGDFSGGIRAGVHDIKDVLLGDAEAVKERAKKRAPEDDPTVWIHIALWIAIVLFILWANRRAVEQQRGTLSPNAGRRGRRGNGGIIVIPGGSSDWGGGWSSGGGSSGGGWSGGGGDFGGGGSSGSW